MAQGSPNKFTSDQGAWTYCGRCGDRTPIKDMQWQRGILLDEKCVDKLLVGDIERSQALYMDTISTEPDLMPDPKLLQPDSGNDDDIYI